MDKQQKLKIALPVLAVVMAIVWGPIIFGSGPKGKDEKSSEKARHDQITSSGPARSGQARTLYAQWGRNPFMPGYDSKAVVLEGIFWDEQNPEAIVNGDILRVGDRIGDHVITVIDQGSIFVRNGDRDIEIRLGEGKQF